MPKGVYVRTDEGRRKISEAKKKYFKNPEAIQKHSEAIKKHFEDPEARKKRSEEQNRPEMKKKKSEGMKKYFEDPEARKKHSESQKKRFENPEARKKNSEIQKRIKGTPEFRKKQSEALIKYFEDPVTRVKVSEANKKYFEDPHSKHYDYCWYGSVRYNYKYKYCELWNRDLLNRIRSFFGNVSVLSGKTKSDNANRNMSCHHVYYQKKACCEWDEDAQGYYAMIDGEKYYIKGDPNKFVTLTAGENTMVEKDKLKWIKIFEGIIENRYNSKCYYTKEEFYNGNKKL